MELLNEIDNNLNRNREYLRRFKYSQEVFSKLKQTNKKKIYPPLYPANPKEKKKIPNQVIYQKNERSDSLWLGDRDFYVFPKTCPILHL